MFCKFILFCKFPRPNTFVTIALAKTRAGALYNNIVVSKVPRPNNLEILAFYGKEQTHAHAYIF